MAKNNYPSTQSYVPIAEIRDNIVVMKDGSLRAVILTSSINFALKSETEQNASVGSYVSFLNSLSFPIQIVVQSRRLNIDEYLERLQSVEREQTNELLRIQTREYREYISQLIDLGNIMSKRFYVVVPYIPSGKKRKGFFSRLSETLRAAAIVKLTEDSFSERQNELNKRLQVVMTGLSNMGLNAVMLNTQNLIELYYNSYNPKSSENQQLVDLEKLRVDKSTI